MLKASFECGLRSSYHRPSTGNKSFFPRSPLLDALFSNPASSWLGRVTRYINLLSTCGGLTRPGTPGVSSSREQTGNLSFGISFMHMENPFKPYLALGTRLNAFHINITIWSGVRSHPLCRLQWAARLREIRDIFMMFCVCTKNVYVPPRYCLHK